MTAGPVVFCSHASADKPQVLAFAERLSRDGFTPWVDRMEIHGGDDFVAKINEGLQKTVAGLIFFSRHVNRSVWVRAEVNFLMHQAVQGMRVIPVMIDWDAPVPPLLAAYIRRGIGDYEAIRDDLLGMTRRPVVGPLPDLRWDELLVQLTGTPEAVTSTVWLSGRELASSSAALPALLRPGYVSAPTDAALAEVGRACGALLFPSPVGARLGALASSHQPGDRLDVVVEAGPELLRLPFETARLPIPEAPLLVADLDGVTVARRPLASPARLTPALPGPLKILAAVAAPDEDSTWSSVLDVERELARILGAVPESGAQVRPLEVASLSQITEALRANAYHVLHLSGHGSTAGIEMEDEDGRAVHASPEEVAAAIRAGGRPLPLLFLSCCDPRTEDVRGLAGRLLEAGIPQIVAMLGTVSDGYATELAARFYRLLTLAQDRDPADALAQARRDLERERERRVSSGAAEPPEYATATLFRQGHPRPVLSEGLPQPLTTRTAVVAGGPVPLLGVDDLVGRRTEVRTALRALTEDGQNGVVLVGMGGVGKSTVAGRVMHRLRDRGWTTATVAGPLNLTAVVRAVRSALDELPDTASLVAKLGEEQTDELLRVERVSRALRDHRLLLVLENFEDNLTVDGSAYREPAIAAVIEALVRAAATGRVLITTRYPLPGIPGLCDLRILPLSRAQARKLILRLPALQDLHLAERGHLLDLTGGHPRLLELVDAAVRGDTGRLQSMTERLRSIAAEQGIDLDDERAELSTAAYAAVEVALRDIALTDLLATLSPADRNVLVQAAVSTIPVCEQMLVNTVEETTDVRAGLRRLLGLALVTPIGDEWFVERWTAQGLRDSTSRVEWRLRNEKAALQRLELSRSGALEVVQAREAVVNLIEASAGDRAADLIASFCEDLIGDDRLDEVPLLCGGLLDQIPPQRRSSRVAFHARARAHRALGLTREAVDQWEGIASRLEGMVARDAGDQLVRQDLVDVLQQLGDAYRDLGMADEALATLQKAFTLAVDEAHGAGDSVVVRRQVGNIHFALGELKEITGDQDGAEKELWQAFLIARELLKESPSDPALNHTTAIRSERYGVFYFRMYDDDPVIPLKFYLPASLESYEMLAQAGWNASRVTCDLARIYRHIGIMIRRQDGPARSIFLFEQSLGTIERLVEMYPRRTEYLREYAAVHEEIAETKALLGRTGAVDNLTRSLTARELLVRLEPQRVDYRRAVAETRSALAATAWHSGNGDEAADHLRVALGVLREIGAENPSRVDIQADLASVLEEIVQVVNGGSAETISQMLDEALDIRERLSRSEPDRFDLQEYVARPLVLSAVLLDDSAAADRAREILQRLAAIGILSGFGHGLWRRLDGTRTYYLRTEWRTTDGVDHDQPG